jgi:hypothetical protein
MPAALAADPASPDNDRDRDEVVRHHDYPVFGAVVVYEVAYENVGERSRPDGGCFVEYDDLDGLVAEWEVTCYY